MAQTVQGLSAAQADEDRTKRAFVGFLSSALGLDQNYTSDDASPIGADRGYVIANPDGSYSAVGQSRSNLQGVSVAGLTITPGLLILAAVAFFILKK